MLNIVQERVCEGAAEELQNSLRQEVPSNTKEKLQDSLHPAV